MTFLGCSLVGHPNEGFGISQNEFVDNLNPIVVDTIIRNNEFCIDLDKRKTRFRQALGGLLWTGITRYDLSYAITKIATDAAEAVTDVNQTRELIKLINKTTDTPNRTRSLYGIFP